MKPLARKRHIVEQNANNETLIYDLITDKAYLLNETSAFVWRSCNGTREVSEISANLSKNSKQPINNDIVWLAIDQLKNNNLIDNAEELVSELEGLSRREVIKKIGLASMITLPVISSLVAPTAAMAQSAAACVANGNPCTFNNYTQSNCCTGSRCDDLAPPRCRSCLGTNGAFGFAPTAAGCDSLSTRNLCCNSTSPPITTPSGVGNFNCFCP